MSFSRLLPVFIILPLLELWLLLKLAGWVGLLPTLILVVSTAVLGFKLLRQQGMDTVARFQQRLHSAQLPLEELGEGLLLFFAGGLLLTPGLVTDILGFSILFRPSRQRLAKRLARLLKERAQVSVSAHQSAQQQMFEQMMRQSRQAAQSHTSAERPAAGRTTGKVSGDIIEGEYKDLGSAD